MLTLILETSGQKSCIVLTQGNEILEVKRLSGGPELSKKLALEVKNLLNGRKPDRIAVGSGPGSYTGIRVGAALAKTLAFGWGIPLFGFCSLAAFGERVLVDAKRGGLYLYEGGKASLVGLEGLIGSYVSPDAEAIKKRVIGLEVEEVEADPERMAETPLGPLELNYLSIP